MMLAFDPASGVIIAACVTALASVVVGYWNSHKAREDAEAAKGHTAHADQKAAYAATVSLSTRRRADAADGIAGALVEQFRDTIANMAAAQADLQKETNAQLVACRESEARLTASNELLTVAVEQQRSEIALLREEGASLRDELRQVRGSFEAFLLQSRDDAGSSS